MAATVLTLSQQPSDLDRNTYVDIKVETNASDYSVVLENGNLSYEKKENNILRITAVADGTCKVTVSAQASGEEITSVNWYVSVSVIPTDLQVDPKPTELNVGDRKVITVTTNAQNGYKVNTTDELKARIINVTDSNFTIEATGIGEVTVTVSATKNNSVLKTVVMIINVAYQAPVDDKGTPTSIRLVNNTTKRTVSIETSANESADDIIVTLPAYSGTLVTEEALETDTKVIKTPSIITPPNNTDDWKGFFIGSPYETRLGSAEEHESTIWEASHDQDFTEIFYLKQVRKGDINDINTLEKTCLEDIGSYVACYVRVKYFSKSHESDWSSPVYIRTAAVALHGMTVPKKIYTRPTSETQNKKYGDFSTNYFGAYYGIVDHSKLVDGYDYRGTWKTIKEKYVKSNYNNSSTLPIRMKKDFQVLHNGKLWYALKEDAPTESANMIEPGKDATMWKEETRTALGTPARVAREIGIGFNLPDANCDGLSTGSTSVGPKANDELGYLKYIYKGKLCYTPVKPICNVIAWTDLAKREAVYGNRTIRLGTELFVVRLMLEDEYKELFTRLTNGTYDNLTSAELGLEQKQWIFDEQEGASRNYMTGTTTKGSLDPKSRTGSWRFVLEYIPDHSAPYNNLERSFPNAQKANNENFIYDRYSDTGYFGVVEYHDFIGGDELNTRAGFTSGSQLYITSPWFKFYWHGQIVYMLKQPSRYSVSYNNIATHNCHHGTDMGGNGKKTITINGCTYRLMNFIGANETPYTRTGFTEGDLGSLPGANLELEKGKYSQWNELFYRIAKGYMGYTDKNGTDEWSNGYQCYHGGYQLGDNWAEYSADELITRYSASNGTACWGRDLSNSTILYRGARGVAFWYGLDVLSHSSAGCAWRCLLSLITTFNVRM